MSTPTNARTITLPTTDHGPVTLPEPAWCAGHADHSPDSYRADLAHKGPEYRLTHNGELLWTAFLAQATYATNPDNRGIGLYVAQEDFSRVLDPIGLYDLAATLETHADRLRELADQLTAILAGGAQ